MCIEVWTYEVVFKCCFPPGFSWSNFEDSPGHHEDKGFSPSKSLWIVWQFDFTSIGLVWTNIFWVLSPWKFPPWCPFSLLKDSWFCLSLLRSICWSQSVPLIIMLCKICLWRTCLQWNQILCQCQVISLGVTSGLNPLQPFLTGSVGWFRWLP